MEAAVKELYLTAQAHFGAYQRYPMAVLMAHPHVLHGGQGGVDDSNIGGGGEVVGMGGPIAAADPLVLAELRAIAAAVHRGYIPIAERCVHEALLTNRFIPQVIDEFIAWCVDEQRHVGLHLRGGGGKREDGGFFPANDMEVSPSSPNYAGAAAAAFDRSEAQQRRDLLTVMFGDMLANDPLQVERLLEQHNDSLFAQLCADKASRYAAAEGSVLKAGPENLGGGLLRHTATTEEKLAEALRLQKEGGAEGAAEAERILAELANADNMVGKDPAGFIEGKKRIARRSLPIPQTDFALPHHEKKKRQHADPSATMGMGGGDDSGLNHDDTVAAGSIRRVRGGGGNGNAAEGDDFDSDATPSDLDSEDHELNKLRIKGYHTQALAAAEDAAHFSQQLREAGDCSATRLRPEIGKLQSLFRQVERNRGAVLAGGGAGAHGSNSMITNNNNNNNNSSASMMMANSVNGTTVNSTFNNTTTTGTRRPSQNIPLARTTVTAHTIAYVKALLEQHIGPQLARLEGCALTKGSRAAAAHASVGALWDEADGLREMCEAILDNHNAECERLGGGGSMMKNGKPSGPSAATYLGYAAGELDEEWAAGSSQAQNNSAARSTIVRGGGGGQQHASPPPEQQQQRNPQRRGASRAGSPAASTRVVGGVNATFLRSNSGVARRSGGGNNLTSSASIVSRGGESVRVNAAHGGANTKGSKTPTRTDPFGGRQQNFPFKPSDQTGSSPPPAPYRHHSRLDATYVNNDSSVTIDQNHHNASSSATAHPLYTSSVYSPAGAMYDDIAGRTRDALSFDASARSTTTPTRRTQSATGSALKNSAEQRNSRYAPLPLFAAQRVHRSQAMQATTARVHLSGEGASANFFTDSDPTKVHLTGEERVDATLQEPLASHDTSGVARRRQLFFYRFGPDEGNKRFTLWLNAQTPRWTREFHRTLEMKGLRFSDLLDAKHAW